MELIDKLVKEYNEGFSAGYNSAMSEWEPQDPVKPPTKLTQDQAIRAKALELTLGSLQNAKFDQVVMLAAAFEDYIRDGRKGDE